MTGVRIGELASEAGVNPKTIRYYEKIGLLPPPGRTPAGHRRYEPAVCKRVTFIKTAQRLGLALDEIREILTLRDRGHQPCTYVRQVLRRELAHIERRIAELDRLHRELLVLDALAEELPSNDQGTCRIIDHVRQAGSAGMKTPRTSHPSQLTAGGGAG